MIGAFVVRFIATVVAFSVATLTVPGIQLFAGQPGGDLATLVIVAAIFGLVNSLVKPLFRVRHTPVYFIALGAALLVVNAALLLLISWLCGLLGVPWRVTGFVPALEGGVIVAIVSFLANTLLGSRTQDHR